MNMIMVTFTSNPDKEYVTYLLRDKARTTGGGSEQRKVTPRNNGKLQTFIACFWSHNWIDKANAGQLLHNRVAPQNNFKNA